MNPTDPRSLIHSGLNRRDFLSVALSTAGALLIAGPLQAASRLQKHPAVSARAWTILRLPISLGKDQLEHTAYLLRRGADVILVNPGADTATLLDSLAIHRVRPHSITAVFLSHYGSGDIELLADAAVTPFRKAELWVGRPEFEWQESIHKILNRENPAIRAGEKLRVFAPGRSSVPGLRLIEASGPSEGHCALAVETWTGTMVLCGELFDRVSIAKPSYVRRRFASPSRTILSRHRILAEVDQDPARLLCTRM